MAKIAKRLGVIISTFLIGIGLISLQGGTPAYAMSAADFTDVPSNYWGYPYIDFSAGSGIINGYQSPDGTYLFLPEKSVTREEAVAMLYRALSAADKLKSAEDFSAGYTDLFSENKIADWARKYVAYGLEYKLIAESELADFTNDSGLGIPATREQVAVWTAKALGRNLSPAYSLIYADKDSISTEKLPFVDLLYRQGIMQGDDTKMFHPANGIKRVEFAAISNRVFESAKTGVYSEDKEVQSYRGAVVSVDSYNYKIIMIPSSTA